MAKKKRNKLVIGPNSTDSIQYLSIVGPDGKGIANVAIYAAGLIEFSQDGGWQAQIAIEQIGTKNLNVVINQMEITGIV